MSAAIVVSEYQLARGEKWVLPELQEMAQCTDGSFYYQPNRDDAGFGSDARMTASCVVAFIFSVPKRSLLITGKEWTISSP